ncbi:MAG: hypothetical protein C0501_18985 [Isosphaera sp.]|nr:hypothetical protein [Isosphaera sp.]
MTRLLLALGALVAARAEASDPKPDPKGAAFFEAKIRPVLVEHCFRCHSADAQKAGKLKGGLRLDTRDGLRGGGDSGPAVVAKDGDSLLLKAIRHDGDLKMPAAKLPAAVVADFEAWVAMGAPDPRAADAAPARDPKTHWAFRPIVRPPVPAVKGKDGVLNPVDAFVLAKLEAAGLAPAPPADRATLLRRATFDLTGLPPTPDEVDAFLKDDGKDAYAGVVDRLLASPRHGERYGRHWLDVVRYADSAGYETDDPYPTAWRYRDYVIASLNADKPFDRFVKEQLAGDELWPDSAEAATATGFLAVGPFAFEGGIGRADVVEYQRRTDLADTTGEAFLGLTVGCARCHNHKFDPISHLDYFGLQAVFAASKPKAAKNAAADGPAMTLTHVAAPPAVRQLRRGELDAPLGVAPPAVPRALPGGGEVAADPKRRRAALATWVTAADNPLTARVIANRVWQWHFGAGLVRTPNDLGTQGEAPTHPELLDWLASELRDHGWSLKHLHRVIMASATYRRAGRGAASAKDPENRLLARFPRRRLEAEAIWDHLHATAGTIDLTAGGPPVYPPVSREALGNKLNVKWESDKYKDQWTRRAVYLVNRRSLVLPFAEAFNVALPVASAGTRDRTVVAPQALELLNGPVAVGQARAFAGRLLRECGTDPAKIADRAWVLAYGRPIRPDERADVVAFLKVERPAGKRPTPLGLPADAAVDPGFAAGVVECALALMNANEFVYVD